MAGAGESQARASAPPLPDLGPFLAGLREAWLGAARDRDRPRVALNMIESIDGRAEVDGRSGGLGNPTDRTLFHGLRSIADAVLVGGSTARAENYGRIIRDPDVRRARTRAGLAPEPLAVIVTRSGALPHDLPLLREPEARVVVVTGASAPELTGVAAHVRYVRSGDDGADLGAALRELHDECGVRAVLSEGGPRLAGMLLTDGRLDELFLSFAPLLAGGEDPVTILRCPPLDPPVPAELATVHQDGSRLFLRYRIGSPTDGVQTGATGSGA